MPGHRRRGHDRLDGRGPADGRGADEIVVLDNLVRGRRQNLAHALADDAVRLVEGDIRDRALVTELMHGTDLVFHLAAIRITQCATSRGWPSKCWSTARTTSSRRPQRQGVRKVIASSSASVYGLATEFPTPENHHPYANDTLYGAAKTFNEGLLRSFHAMRAWTTSRCVTSTSTGRGWTSTVSTPRS